MQAHGRLRRYCPRVGACCGASWPFADVGQWLTPPLLIERGYRVWSPLRALSSTCLSIMNASMPIAWPSNSSSSRTTRSRSLLEGKPPRGSTASRRDADQAREEPAGASRMNVRNENENEMMKNPMQTGICTHICSVLRGADHDRHADHDSKGRGRLSVELNRQRALRQNVLHVASLPRAHDGHRLWAASGPGVGPPTDPAIPGPPGSCPPALLDRNDRLS